MHRVGLKGAYKKISDINECGWQIVLETMIQFGGCVAHWTQTCQQLAEVFLGLVPLQPVDQVIS